jgi:hypothetical protein
VNEAGALQISRRSRENEVQNCWMDATVVMTAGGVSQVQRRDSRRRTNDITDRVRDIEGCVRGKLHRAHNGRLRADKVRRGDTRKRWRVKVSARPAAKEYGRKNKPGARTPLAPFKYRRRAQGRAAYVRGGDDVRGRSLGEDNAKRGTRVCHRMREQMGAVHLSPTPVGDKAGRVWAGSSSYMRVRICGIPTASGQLAMDAARSELGCCVVLARLS